MSTERSDTTPSSQGLESLGPTIQRLRKAAGYSLNAFSVESGVAKSMLSRIENNESNPTLSTMWRISQALNRSMEELLRELDSRPALIEHLKSQELPILISEDGLCELRVTGALETVEWLQCYELKAELGGTLSSSPHPDGSIESLYVRSGQAELTVDGQSFLVGAGELARYRGDVPHCIIAQGDEPLFATMTVSRR